MLSQERQLVCGSNIEKDFNKSVDLVVLLCWKENEVENRLKVLLSLVLLDRVVVMESGC